VVEDNGLGIPAESMGTSSSTSSARTDQDEALGNEGSGLGLAIVREVRRSDEGRDRVGSTAGVGTTFVIVLPDRPDRRGEGG
jgi:signal transduction histidine kinase